MNSMQAAFMSYSQIDDRNSGNFISKLREKLSDEVQLQRGQAFNIFQDKVNLTVGDNWKRILHETLDEVGFLIPIMTPNFFTSEACREEVAYFLKREQRLHRDDLILPIYYISSEIVNDPDRRKADPEAAIIYNQLSSRQYSDWRDLRKYSISAPAVKKRIMDLAREIASRISDQELKDTPLVEQAAESPNEEESPVPTPPYSTQTVPEYAASVQSEAEGRLRLVPPLEKSSSLWQELSQALARVNLTPADSSLLAVRTLEIRRLMGLDYPHLGDRDEEIRYIISELSNTINSMVLAKLSAAENTMGCRVANRQRSMLTALISEAL
jgi:hypothetical protein